MGHYAKFGWADARNMLRHYERAKNKDGEYIKYGNRSIDTSRAYLNPNICKEHNKSQSDFHRERLEKLQFRRQKNNVVMCDCVVDVPKKLAGTDAEPDFFQRTYDFLAEKHGRENIISAYVHYDETTPHMHFAFVPVVIDKKTGVEKLSARSVFHPAVLKQFHPALDEYLRDTIPAYSKLGANEGVITGTMTAPDGKKRENLAIEVYKEIKDETDKLKSEISGLRQEKQELDGLIQEKQNLQKENQELKSVNNTLQSSNDTLQANIGILQKQLAEIESQRIKKEKRVKELEEETRKKNQELEKIKQEVRDKKPSKIKAVFKAASDVTIGAFELVTNTSVVTNKSLEADQNTKLALKKEVETLKKERIELTKYKEAAHGWTPENLDKYILVAQKLQAEERERKRKQELERESVSDIGTDTEKQKSNWGIE